VEKLVESDLKNKRETEIAEINKKNNDSGWFGGWFGGGSQKEDHVDLKITDEEIKEIHNMIKEATTSDTHQVECPDEYEWMKIRLTQPKGCFKMLRVVSLEEKQYTDMMSDRLINTQKRRCGELGTRQDPQSKDIMLEKTKCD
jgi:hypothetical protein